MAYGLCSSEFALEVIRRLLSYTPSSLILVIHGLEALGGKMTQSDIRQLVEIIRDKSYVAVVKAFFSTNGISQVWEDRTTETERIDAFRMVQDRLG